MQTIAVFGCGERLQMMLRDRNYKDCKFTAIFDNDKAKQGTRLQGIPVFSLDEIKKCNFDSIVITPRGCKWIMVQQLLGLGIEANKIKFYCHVDDLDIFSEVDDEGSIYADIDGIKLLVQHASDEMIINEVLLEQGYQFHFGGADVQKVVVDIGMNVGIASLYFAKQKGVKRVYGFEPFRDPFYSAIENFKLNGYETKIIAKQYAISDVARRERVPFNKDWITASRTFFSELPQNVLEDIELRDAATVFRSIREKEGDHKAYIVKIDCEGSEYQVLESLERAGELEKIDMILGETHDAREEEAFAYLQRHGYSYFYHRVSPTQFVFKAVRMKG